MRMEGRAPQRQSLVDQPSLLRSTERFIHDFLGRLRTEDLGHLAEAITVPPTFAQGCHQSDLKLAQRRASHLVVLQEIDDEPLSGRLFWEVDAAKEKPATTKLKLARAAPVVDERDGEHRGRTEPQRVPVGRPGEDERLIAEEGAKQRRVCCRSVAESGERRGVVEAVTRVAEFAFTYESTGQPGGVGAPLPEVARSIDAARLKFGFGGCGHDMIWMKSTVENIRSMK